MEQSLEGGEGASHVDIWGKNVLTKGTGFVKALRQQHASEFVKLHRGQYGWGG